ncbi:hypothetical protein DA456_18600 [Pseudomonas syringae pv. atrofaciens]|uniref:Uncharacterized protein n=1 Tax=Pseudomonas syringae pv. atrofaciens TaxID=192087 RepID=A0AAD0ID05_PSESX|nr:hypothetical protein DA456_18600 [Pseudomonas syringae pv. atrofaciens]PCK90143.1 hypothetical protein PsyrCH409_20475 [Pseudomonas viridiflava]
MTVTIFDYNYRNNSELGLLIELMRRQWIAAEIEVCTLHYGRHYLAALGLISEAMRIWLPSATQQMRTHRLWKIGCGPSLALSLYSVADAFGCYGLRITSKELVAYESVNLYLLECSMALRFYTINSPHTGNAKHFQKL